MFFRIGKDQLYEHNCDYSQAPFTASVGTSITLSDTLLIGDAILDLSFVASLPS